MQVHCNTQATQSSHRMEGSELARSGNNSDRTQWLSRDFMNRLETERFSGQRHGHAIFLKTLVCQTSKQIDKSLVPLCAVSFAHSGDVPANIGRRAECKKQIELCNVQRTDRMISFDQTILNLRIVRH